MQTLKLDPKYADSVREGKKTSTTRKGWREGFKAGDDLILDCGGSNQLKTIIADVEWVYVNELVDDDALRDGFKDTAELVNALKHHYPDLEDTSQLTIISFEYVGEVEDNA